MCYRPVTIMNPKLCKNNVYDKAQIEVPCGHCIECKQQRQLSWFVRYYYEWKYCISKGGFAYFLTNTYNEDSIPRFFPNFDFKELKKYGYRHTTGIRCFSKRDIQLYFKRIRKRLSRDYPGLDLRGVLKYAVTMEMGACTHRPHYHIIFFVASPFVRPWHFRQIVKDIWSSPEHMNKGFTMEGKFNNGFVINGAGFSYVAKYVTKDLLEEKYFKVVHDLLLKNGISEQEMNYYFPHNLQSKGLGLYALECDEFNDLDNFFNGEIVLPDKEQLQKKYKLPLYLERKLFYSVKYRFFDTYINDYVVVDDFASVPSYFSYSPIYVLNELGLEMKDKRLEKVIDSTRNVYNVVLGIPENKSYIDKVNEKFKTSFDSLSAFQTIVKDNLPEEVFLSYSLVYRGCVTPSSYGSCLHNTFDARIDYNLIQMMSSGIIPDKDSFDALCYNIDSIQSINLIEDYYQIIRYIFKLVHLEKETIFLKREEDYLNQKTAYLQNKYRFI